MTNPKHSPVRRPTDSARRALGAIERPMAISYGVIGAVLLLGAIGYVLDGAFDTAPWLLIIGLAGGVVVGLALLAASITRRSSKRST